MVLGILGEETPVIAAMARAQDKADGESRAVVKRIYRLLDNRRVQIGKLYEGLYQVVCTAVAQETPEYLVVAVDPVNFEKPYAKRIEGVSTVYKSTLPDLSGHARLAHGYPAITATVVNTRVPATRYANWFSYQIDFISQNKEIEQAFETMDRLYPGYRVRFVGDAGLNGQNMFAQVGRLGKKIVFRASHLERIVEVYNERLDHWEREVLQDLTETVLYQVTFEVRFQLAGRTRLDRVQFGWFQIRLFEHPDQSLWVLGADNSSFKQPLVLLTNVPLKTIPLVQQV